MVGSRTRFHRWGLFRAAPVTDSEPSRRHRIRMNQMTPRSYFRKLIAVAAICVSYFAAYAWRSAEALQYQRVPLNPPGIIISARGPIIPGDTARLFDFLSRLPATDRAVAFSIDSAGGNVLEGEKLAGAIRSSNIPIYVGQDSQCSSACFLLFAAAGSRFMAPDALIGVHSVSENGRETLDSMAFTTAFARDAAALGVPPAIIGKLVETPPQRATWLTPSDLASMSVVVLDETASASTDPSQSQELESSAPAPAPAPPDQTSMSAASAEGLADRRAWENWFSGLNGAFKEGAEYWAGQRSTPRPGSCYGQAEQSLGDWTAGCLAARQILTPSDRRRKSDPEYRAGWNSF
jgi:hypothetical protein